MSFQSSRKNNEMISILRVDDYEQSIKVSLFFTDFTLMEL